MRQRPVLIVEDNEDAAVIIRTALEHAGYRVMDVRNGAEALSLLSSVRPSVVLLDVVLPGMDGWQVLERLRAQADLKDVPVICVTANALRESRDRALALGCAAYLTKPVEPFRLVKEVGRILGSPGDDGTAGETGRAP